MASERERQMPGQRETKGEIKLIKSLVQIISKCVHSPAEIHPNVQKRGVEEQCPVRTNSCSSPRVADTLTPEPGVFSAAHLYLPCPVPISLLMSRIPASNDQRD